MRVLLLDSQVGNIRSVLTALRTLALSVRVLHSGAELRRAQSQSRILIFPGVGEAQSTMDALKEHHMDTALLHFIAHGGAVLGICVGAQLLLDTSQERNTKGLGVISGTSKLLIPMRDCYGVRLKVPQIGWNSVRARGATALFAGIPQGSAFYFVHSYYTHPTVHAEQIAWCEYGHTFPVAFARNNVWGVQFHPEKSGRYGLQVLANFVRCAARRQADTRPQYVGTTHTNTAPAFNTLHPAHTHTTTSNNGTPACAPQHNTTHTNIAPAFNTLHPAHTHTTTSNNGTPACAPQHNTTPTNTTPTFGTHPHPQNAPCS